MPKNPPHLWYFRLETSAHDTVRAMQSGHRRRFFEHLRQLLNADAPFECDFVESLAGQQYKDIRKFRIGDYRVLFALDTRPFTHLKHSYKGIVVILVVDWRKDVYRP